MTQDEAKQLAELANQYAYAYLHDRGPFDDDLVGEVDGLTAKVVELVRAYNELKEAASAFLQCDDPDGFILKHGDQYERLMVALSDGKTGGTV